MRSLPLQTYNNQQTRPQAEAEEIHQGTRVGADVETVLRYVKDSDIFLRLSSSRKKYSLDVEQAVGKYSTQPAPYDSLRGYMRQVLQQRAK